MGYLKTFSLLVFAFLFTNQTHSQSLSDMYVSPGVSIGYTIGGRMSYGLELDLGLVKFHAGDTPYNMGVSFSKYWTQMKKKTHRHFTANVMLESTHFDFKIGYGRVKNIWGYGKRNLCRISGLNLDLSLTGKSMYYPWVGYKTFIYDTYLWTWYDQYYKSVYIKYKYDFLERSDTKTIKPTF